MPQQSILDIARRIGQRLEIETGSDSTAWTRYPLLERIRAIVKADLDLSAHLDQLAGQDDRRWLDILRRHSPQRIVRGSYTAVAITATASQRHRVYQLGNLDNQQLAAVTAWDQPVELVEQNEIDSRLRDPYATPALAQPVAVVKGTELHLYAARSGPAITVTTVIASPWHSAGFGTVAVVSANWKRLTCADAAWTVNAWANAYTIIDTALYSLAATGYQAGNVNTATTFDLESEPLTAGVKPFQLVNRTAPVSYWYAEALALIAAAGLAADDPGSANLEDLRQRAGNAVVSLLAHGGAQ